MITSLVTHFGALDVELDVHAGSLGRRAVQLAINLNRG